MNKITIFLIDLVLHAALATILTIFFPKWYVFAVVMLTIFLDITKIKDGHKAVARLGDVIIFETKRDLNKGEEGYQKPTIFARFFFNPFMFLKISIENTTPDPHNIVLGDGEYVIKSKDDFQVKMEVSVNIFKDSFRKIESAGSNDVFKMVLADFSNSMRKIMQAKTFDEIKEMADLTWNDLKEEIRKIGTGKNLDQLEEKLEKYGLGIESIDIDTPTLKNKKTNEATEKSAQQKLENQAKKENTDEFLKRVAKAKINNLIPLSLLTEQDCKKKVKGVEEDSVEMYNKALVIALKEAKKNGATPDQIKEVNDKATQDLKIFEGLTTETIISNKGDGPAAVPIHTVAAASSAGKK